MPLDPWSLGVPPASAAPARFLDLSGSESPFGCSSFVIRAVAARLEAPGRAPDEAARRLREALSRRHNVPPERILLGAGTRVLLPAMLAALVPAGGSIAMPATAPPLHALASSRCGRTVLPVEDWRRGEAWDQACSGGAHGALLCHPHNPTGAYLARDELAGLQAAMRRHGVFLVVDEAYADVASAEDFPRVAARLDEWPGLVVMRTFSSTHALSGLPTAYALLSSEAAARLAEADVGIAPGEASAAAAAAAMEDSSAFAAMVAERTARARFRLRRALEEAGVEVRAGQGPWVMVKGPEDACRRLAARGVRVRDLADWGYPGWMRVRSSSDGEVTAFLEGAQALFTGAA